MTDTSFGAALARLWPRAPHAAIEAVTAIAETVFNKYGIETPLERAHFMAQISHECGAGTIVREDMNYSAERIVEIFGYDKAKQRWMHSARVTDAEALQLAHHPQALAERVYGLGNPTKAKELGNIEPGDGYRCRGAGMLQLTGRGALVRIGAKTGFDLAGNPDQLADPAISFRVAAAEFVALKCLEPAQADDVAEVTRRVNGGRNGLAERTVWLRKWKNALDGVEEPARRPRAAPEPAKPITQSKIAQGSMVGGALATAGAAREITQTASEVSSAARDTADNAGAVVTVAKPFLASPTLPWALLAIAVVVALGFVFWKRYRKLKDEGV
jgi:putative chitinase